MFSKADGRFLIKIGIIFNFRIYVLLIIFDDPTNAGIYKFRPSQEIWKLPSTLLVLNYLSFLCNNNRRWLLLHTDNNFMVFKMQDYCTLLPEMQSVGVGVQIGTKLSIL